MDKDNKSKIVNDNKKDKLWGFWAGFFYSVLIFIIAQLFPIVLVLYPVLIKHYTFHQALNWLGVSIYAQFFTVLIFELLIILSILFFLKRKKLKYKVIGLRKFVYKDILYGFVGIFIYFILYFLVVFIISMVFKNLNINQKQNVGFNSATGFIELTITFLSLVIIAPIAEEMLFRGFLYTTFRGKLPIFWAAILTSIIFASLHLPEGVGGPLWIGALDTFTLSMVLVYLREKTGGLYSGMIVHGLKNGLAFFILYISPIIAIIRIH